MLVISRKENDKITIGDDITLTIVRVQGNQVRIGIDAPKDLKVWRNDYEEKNANPND